MKNIILLAFVASIYSASAQKFEATAKFKTVNERSIGQEEEGTALIDLVASGETSNTLAVLAIPQLDLLEDVHISVLSDPYLEGITEILKVELEYSSCCISTSTHYFLVSNDKNFIALPAIKNLYCDTTQSDIQYIFPNQAKGQEGKIIRAELQYTETYTIKDIKVLQSFFWNDDDFDNEEAITAIN